jgi:hypothetical protein
MAHIAPERESTISILEVGMRPRHNNRRKVDREFLAIERYQMPDGSLFFIETPVTELFLKSPADLQNYLESHRNHSGQTTGDPKHWEQGLKIDCSNRTWGVRMFCTSDFSREISGDPHYKSLSSLRKTRRQAEAANREFLNEILA